MELQIPRVCILSIQLTPKHFFYNDNKKIKILVLLLLHYKTLNILCIMFCVCFLHLSTKAWDPECCLVQFEKDGIIQTKEKRQRQHNGFTYSQNWNSQQKVRWTLCIQELVQKPIFLLWASFVIRPFECMCLCRPRFTESTESRAASHPAVVRTQKAAAAHQSRHTNPPTMKASPNHCCNLIIK